jgi:hypothetical protein
MLIIPLAFAFVGTIFYLFQDVEPWTKLLMVALLVGSIALRFAGVHFLIPLSLELIVAIWLVIWWQIE